MIAKQLKIAIQQAAFCNGSSLTLVFQFYMKSFRISRNVHDYGLHDESFWWISLPLYHLFRRYQSWS